LIIDSVPIDIVNKLKNLQEQTFTNGKDFLNAIEKVIGAGQTVKYKLAILKRAKKVAESQK
jgi:hypothetical protein